METHSVLEQRKQKVFSFLTQNKNILIYAILLFIAFMGYIMRTRNLPLLKDITTGQYIPVELDSFAFLRYAQYILEHGHIMDFDPMRYYPNGYYPSSEFSFVSHLLVWMYKFFHLFNSNITLEYIDAIYPPLAFVLGLFFFFLLVRRLFDWRVALLSSAFLSVISPYIYRTIAGFSDKEAFGMMFLFLAFYLLVCAFQTTSFKKGLLFAVLSGLTTALMGYAWGGVQFLFVTVGIFALFAVLFDYFSKHDLFVYSLWFLTALLTLTFTFETRFTFSSIVFSELYAPLLLAFFIGVLKIIIEHYKFFTLPPRVHKYIPLGVFLFFVVLGLAFLFILFVHGWDFYTYKYHDLTNGFLNPFGTTRWSRTVAESHQPYISDWFSQFGSLNFWFFILGTVAFVYSFLSTVTKKYRYIFTLAYFIFFSAVLVSRYSSTPPFNGETGLATFMYLGALFFFPLFVFIFYLYLFHKKREVYIEFHTIKKEYLLAFFWLLVMIITARLAVRILFVFAPIVSIFIAYLYVRAYDAVWPLKSRAVKIIFALLALYLLFSPTAQASLTSLYQQGYGSVTYSGPAYTQQWQVAMDWVRKSTPEDAVFAHWWDYGYWVQGGGQRTTLTDGGNNGGSGLNYFMGRNVLTGANNTEALEFLKVKKATHLLMISDEIGKYGAFSSIGSNTTMDRFSTIPAFTLSPSESLEQRNQTLFVYRGGAAFDEDIYYEGKLFPAYSSGIAAILIPFSTHGDTSSVQQPRAVVVYQGQQVTLPLKCLYIDQKEIVFPEKGLDACFQIIPAFQGNTGNVVGAGFYLSRRVWNTLFTHLYLFNQSWEGFSLAYTDEASVPLGMYNGRVFGPIKIWNITYPDYIPYNSFYEQTTLPDERLALS